MSRYINIDEVKQVWAEQAPLTYQLIKDDLDKFLTADVVERKKGKWINCVNSEHWKCNQCGCRAGFWYNEENSSEWEKDMSEWLSDFCPNCGAEMEADDEQIRQK